MKKKWEGFFPYVISIIPFWVIWKWGNGYIQSKNLNDALDAILTVSSLIIGFIGAILPVILSMKNDSKIVKYVFEKDKDKLFLKYIKQTILTGIVLIIFAVSLYFRDCFLDSWYYKHCIAIICYSLTCFLLCTYRSLENILNLIFSDDHKLLKEDGFNEKSEKEKEFERSFKHH